MNETDVPNIPTNYNLIDGRPQWAVPDVYQVMWYRNIHKYWFVALIFVWLIYWTLVTQTTTRPFRFMAKIVRAKSKALYQFYLEKTGKLQVYDATNLPHGRLILPPSFYGLGRSRAMRSRPIYMFKRRRLPAFARKWVARAREVECRS
ncbi:hypothetical protein TWF694_011245 [Orbilia ellipsospora]|uniref:Uncharacterized protein n=1 Tax=Orbilia ellipsospora TaxID=2528407 RepID=A0AAV9X9N0_9PEZI